MITHWSLVNIMFSSIHLLFVKTEGEFKQCCDWCTSFSNTLPYTQTKIKNATLLFLSPFFWELKDLGHFLCTGKAYFSQILFTNLSKEEQSVICSQLVRGTFNWYEGTNLVPCSFSEFSVWVWPEPVSLSLSLSLSLLPITQPLLQPLQYFRFGFYLAKWSLFCFVSFLY